MTSGGPTNSKSFKKRAREVQEIRGCDYMVAMRELQALPPDTDLRSYVEMLRENTRTGRRP